MTMDDTAPDLDGRSFDDLVAQTEALATLYSRWRPPDDGSLDFGSALVRLFARMVVPLVTRLNQVPAKHHLAFVDLLGAERVPPRAARAPITFHLAPGASGDALVPAGTQVAATTPDGALVFETESDIQLTRAQLVAAFVRDVALGRYADRTAIATGSVSGPFDGLGVADNHPVEHELYVAVESLLSLPGVTQLVLTVDAKAAALPAQTITWAAWDGTQWAALPAVQLVSTQIGLGPAPRPLGPAPPVLATTKWILTADATHIVATTVNGASARWLRGTVPTSMPAVQVSATVSASGSASTPDAAFFNTVALDVTRDLLPFGERPRFNDVFYIGCDAAFAITGAAVTLDFKLSTLPWGTVGASSVQLKWEAWDGKQATALTLTGDNTATFTVNGRVAFTLPAAIPRADVGGVTSRWIRVRLVGGNYGTDITVDSTGTKVLAATFKPPSFASITIGWSVSPPVSPSAPPSACLRRTDLTYEDMTAAAAAGTLLAYRAVTDTKPALYLGFDVAFETAATTLYVQVFAPPSPALNTWDKDPPPRNPPHVTWEYWNGSDWKPLTADDATQGLSRSGLVRFLSARDAAQLLQFGQLLYWLRARSLDDTFSPMPQIGRVLTNTMWAAQALTTRRETLGGSNGTASQVFTLSRTPVLEGQQIEVGERDLPAADEQAQLAVEEGPDAISDGTDPGDGSAIHWVRWHAVPDFWGSGPRDRHYMFDAESGEITFGDGRHGLIPPPGLRNVRAASYRWGGGTAANVAAGAIAQLKSAPPLVDGAVNREPASGGAAIEPADDMVARASRTLRHGRRAVAAQDFADLALEASTAVARAVTITPSFSPIDQASGAKTGPNDLTRDGRVLVVIVPAAATPGSAPTVDMLVDVESYLDDRAAPGAAVTVMGPFWVPVDVTARVVATSIEESDAVNQRVHDAIADLLDPITGGDGNGWDFGRRPRPSDLAARITAVDGVDHVSYLAVKCDPPFDVDDTANTTNLTLDQLSLYARLLIYARSIVVTTP
jgi:hypothetical protein